MYWALVGALIALLSFPFDSGAATGDDADPINALPAATPDSNSYGRTRTFLKSEDADRYDELFYDAVVSGCSHPVPGSGYVGTFSTTPCVAYPGGYRISDTTASINYQTAGSASTDVCWVAVTAAASGNSGNFVRVGTSHYAVDCVSSSEPTPPTDGQIVLKTTITGGSISAVVDRRRLSVVSRIGARSTFSDLVLASGDFAWASDTTTLYVGDGSTAGGIAIAGGGGGGIDSIEMVAADGVTFTGSPANPLTSNGTFTINLGTITPDAVDTTGHIAAGDATLSDTISVYGAETYDDTSGTVYGTIGQCIVANTAAANTTGIGVYGLADSFGSTANVDSGGLIGVKGRAVHRAAYQNSNLYGGYFTAAMSSGNTDGNIIGSYNAADVNATTGSTIAAALYGAYNIATHAGTGTIPLIYGAYNLAFMDAGAAVGTTLIGNYSAATEGTGTATNLVAYYALQPEGASSLNCAFYLQESTSNGINYICVKVPALGTNWTWTIPTTDGNANEVLTTDGSGVTSWADVDTLTAGDIYDIGMWKEGFPTDSGITGGFVFDRAVTCPDDFSGSQAKFTANFAATKTYDIYKNTSDIGDMSCSSGGSTCTFTTSGGATNFAAGDQIRLYAPSTVDTTARDQMVTFKCTRD